MSRTRRRALILLNCNDKPLDNKRWDFDEAGEHSDYYSKRNSKYDQKCWHKSSSSFKKIMNKQRKAKEKQAMIKKDYENVPFFKHENDWLWN